MRPNTFKTYPGAELKPGLSRTTYKPDYGRCGKLWVHGGFEPATGQVVTLLSPSRDSTSRLQQLKIIMLVFPADRCLSNEDNMSINIFRQFRLALTT